MSKNQISFSNLNLNVSITSSGHMSLNVKKFNHIILTKEIFRIVLALLFESLSSGMFSQEAFRKFDIIKSEKISFENRKR